MEAFVGGQWARRMVFRYVQWREDPLSIGKKLMKAKWLYRGDCGKVMS
jgi:hypothetical protein